MKIIHKIGWFIFHYDEYFVNTHYYECEGETYKGYELGLGWYFCGIFGYDRITFCCSEEQLDKELKIRGIDIN
jgi:hypothetical protein